MPILSPKQRLMGHLIDHRLPPAGVCTDVRSQLPLFVTDEITGRNVDRLYPDLANHLDICPTCRQEYTDLAWFMDGAFEVANE